jgi:uncharacterized protein
MFSALAFLVAIIFAFPAMAGPTFPERGRAAVVDGANVIQEDDERALNARVAAWDRRTGHQLVIATVPSLQGYDIKDFGYQLGRAWGLGKKGQDDGVILLLAPTERRVRIEVGYGLEPVLSDATASGIIGDDVAPKLKAGEIPAALSAGADRIMATVNAAGSAAVARPSKHHGGSWAWLIAIVALMVGGAFGLLALRSHRKARALAARRDVAMEAMHDSAAALQRFAAQSRDLGRSYRPPSMVPNTEPTKRQRPPDVVIYRTADTAGSYDPPSFSSDSSSSDWGGSSSSSSDSGFDSGGGSFGGGGADSSY